MAHRDVPFWRRYLRIRGPDVAADVDDEMSFHIEMRTAELVAAGLDPAEARSEALRRMGGVEALKRTCREIGEERETKRRRREWFGAFMQDVRLGVRQLLLNPLLSGLAIVTLALGIGANTAIFGIVYAVLLRPLPYAHSDRLTRLSETTTGLETGVGPGQYDQWVARARAFDAISAYNSTTFNLTFGGTAERVDAAFVTPSFFKTHEMRPLFGRYFLAEEEEPGRNRVVVLSHALFTQRFGGDPHIVGATIPLNGEPFTVVGVAPREFTLTAGRDLLWVPLALSAKDRTKFDDHWLTVFGRRKEGVSLLQAQRDMERVSREIAELHPVAMTDRSARVFDFREDLIGEYRRQLVVLFAAVLFVLLLVCTNVVNLLLARLAVRRKEMAVRAALGASRMRITRQLMTESMVLAAIGGVASLIVAKLSVHLLLRIAPPEVPRLQQAGVDGTVVAFLLFVTMASGALLGLIPALRGSRGELQHTLRQGSKGTGVDGTRDHVRSALVIAEIALALVLLTGAGLFIRSARNLQRIDPGFDTANLVSVRLSLPPASYPTSERVVHQYEDIVTQVRALPGVRAAAAVSHLPIEGWTLDVGLRVEGKTYEPGRQPFAHFRSVTPGYFETMRIPIVSGRSLHSSDGVGVTRVAVINETLARGLWPDGGALGRHFGCCGEDSARVWFEVIGIARDVHHRLTQRPLPEMYVSVSQAPTVSWTWLGNSLALVIRTDGAPARIIPAVRQVIRSVDPTLPLYNVETLDDVFARVTSANRFNMLMLTALGALALILAGVGVYGIVAYFVSQRTQEIGVRVALGARTRDIVALVVRNGAALAFAGIGAGLLLALALSRAVAALLYQVGAADPGTYIIVSAGLALITLAACYVPARRAARVDPAQSLRG
jgi:putative ABC transport system permease protein